MNPDPSPQATAAALASLRRLRQPRSPREHCELCSIELAADHTHLVELSSRRLACVCEACALLFDHQAAARYRRVPRRAEYWPDFRLTDLQWEGLGVPIHLAFFLHSSPAGRVVVVYPSPAGVTEAPLPPEGWEGLVEENPDLRTLEPDVEALLVNRIGPARDHFRVGIDECYRLAGLLRTHWRGFSGGDELWQQIGQFFAGLKGRSRQRGGSVHA